LQLPTGKTSQIDFRYNPPQEVVDYANSLNHNPIKWCNKPEDALKNADVIVTDTWISMGMEKDKETRIRDFDGWQLTKNLIETGGAKSTWKFMHCLPRKKEEVDDDVFYDSKRSLVWMEAENRKYTIMAVFELMLNNLFK
jgi:ornithine carbamoyltransferase